VLCLTALSAVTYAYSLNQILFSLQYFTNHNLEFGLLKEYALKIATATICCQYSWLCTRGVKKVCTGTK